MDNCCNNTGEIKPVVKEESKTITQPYDYTKELEKDNNYLRQQLKFKDEELSCKCEIIAELEIMIINLYSQHIEGGQQKAVIDMGTRIADIFKKYNKGV